MEILKDIVSALQIATPLALLAYYLSHLFFRIKRIEDERKEEKKQKVKEDDLVDSDLKGISAKINTAKEDFNREIKSINKTISDNHLELSKTLSEIKGSLRGHNP